uniref:Protein kinase domain-containing protein n=1 Tax=Octactis speculum TaxID=3111310 RepID=A0A7S2MF62_9STRA
MAPEMFHGFAYNPLKCDIWSLGCVLLELHLRGEFEDRWLTHHPRVIDGNFHFDEFIEDLKLELEIISSEIKDSSFHSLLMSTLQISPRQRSSASELIPHDQNVRKVIHGTKLPPTQVKGHRLRIRIDDSMPEYESGPDDDILAQFDRKISMNAKKKRKISASPGCISRMCFDFD